MCSFFKVFILSSNQLLNTANAKDSNTDYYFTISCLIKAGNMKMYGIGFFLLFLRPFWKIFVFLENCSTEFQKSGTNGTTGQSPVCLHTPISSFYLAPLSIAFEKVCGVNFLPKFLDFRELPTQICDFGFKVRTDCGKLPCISG